MKVLVTGGAGFIGSHLVDRLVQNHEVLVVDNLSTGLTSNINPQAAFIELDINDSLLDGVFGLFKPDIVFHLAAHISVANSIKDPWTDMQNNITGSINVFSHCVNYRIHKVIYSSSAAVYGNPKYLGLDEQHPIEPVSFYGVSKYAAEMYLTTFAKLFGLNYTILRYANVYGPRQQNSSEAGVVTIILNQLLKGERPTIYGDGEQTRDFIFVSDVVDATLKAMIAANNEILNIGSGKQTSINNLAAVMLKLSGATSVPIYLPARVGDIKESHMNPSKAFNLLSWVPHYSLEDGLSTLISAVV